VPRGAAHLRRLRGSGPGRPGQRQRLSLSGDSTLTVAEESAHDIDVDQPELTVGSIERVAAKAASRADV